MRYFPDECASWRVKMQRKRRPRVVRSVPISAIRSRVERELETIAHRLAPIRAGLAVVRLARGRWAARTKTFAARIGCVMTRRRPRPTRSRTPQQSLGVCGYPHRKQNVLAHVN